jgi:hypothetical protein
MLHNVVANLGRRKQANSCIEEVFGSRLSLPDAALARPLLMQLP